MARTIEGPWFRASKRTWYATFQGRKVSLKVRGEANEREATRAWHRLMGGLPIVIPTKPTPITMMPTPTAEPPKPKGVTVQQVADAFSQEGEGRVKDHTLEVRRCRLVKFAAAFGKLEAESIDKRKVDAWTKSMGWAVSSRNGVIATIKAAFNHAMREGIIKVNPLAFLKKPTCESRGAKSVITDADHQRLLKAADASFRTFLMLLRETGARPCELASLKASDVDADNAVAIIREHKTADATGKPRTIFFSPAAMTIVRKLLRRHPDGHLLHDQFRRPWTKDTICRTMKATADRAGVKATCYSYRHSFATSALAAGVPDAHVAALLGHSSVKMLHRHYAHLTSQAAVLRDALSKVRG